MIEQDTSFLDEYKTVRPNSYYLLDDATKINFLEEFKKVNFPKVIDYLQIDLEISNRTTLTTLENLNNQVMDTYKFAIITFEHDLYASKYYGSEDLFDIRKISREIFENRGYLRVFSDVKNQGNPYEDWYIHPDLVDMNFVYKIINNQSLEHTEIINIIKENYS